MIFTEILGQEHIKKHLTNCVDKGRISHAQMFVGKEGSGTLAMAIAYARYILCSNNKNITEHDSACDIKFQHLSHPDLHFVYPTVSTDDVKSKPKSIDFVNDWRKFVLDNPYAGLFDWYNTLGVQNKQGLIRVEDAHEILKTLSLKSYEGGYKILIIWMADKMNVEASNKLLKILEEPPEQTAIILITEDEESIIDTIKSRCQILNFPPLKESDIVTALTALKNIDQNKANKIAHQAQGNYNLALQLIDDDNAEYPFEQWFITWIRAAFKAKGNAGVISELIKWSEDIAALGRETQKKFLEYCIDVFRQALLFNYGAKDIVYFEAKDQKFALNKFAPFVNGNNIHQIFQELSEAIFHIERNGNSKIILTDLSIKLTRLIHHK